jgi:hypothetical protein
MKLEFARQIFEKYWDIIFHENSSSEAELFREDRQTMKIIVAFHSFANAPKKCAKNSCTLA